MPKVTVLPSNIHGKGFFAGRPFKKGESIDTVKGDVYRKINKTMRDVFANPDWIGVAENTWIDPRPPYKFINHSCSPSAGVRGKVTLVARRNLKAGDEITLDYSTIEGDPHWEMRCACGTKNCRKTIRSIHFLPYTVYMRYLPYIPTYFQKLYKEKRYT